MTFSDSHFEWHPAIRTDISPTGIYHAHIKELQTTGYKNIPWQMASFVFYMTDEKWQLPLSIEYLIMERDKMCIPCSYKETNFKSERKCLEVLLKKDELEANFNKIK